MNAKSSSRASNLSLTDSNGNAPTQLPKWFRSYSQHLFSSIKNIQNESNAIHDQLSESQEIFRSLLRLSEDAKKPTSAAAELSTSSSNPASPITATQIKEANSSFRMLQSQISFHLDCIEDYTNIVKSQENSLRTHLSSSLAQVLSLKNRIRSLVDQQKDYDSILNTLMESVIESRSSVINEASKYNLEELSHGSSSHKSRKRKHMGSSTKQKAKTEYQFMKRFKAEYFRLREEYDVMKTLPDKILKWNNRRHLTRDDSNSPQKLSSLNNRDSPLSSPFSMNDTPVTNGDDSFPDYSYKEMSTVPQIHPLRQQNSLRDMNSVPSHSAEFVSKLQRSNSSHNSSTSSFFNNSQQESNHNSSTESLRAENKLHHQDHMHLQSVIRNVSSSVNGNNFHNIQHFSSSDEDEKKEPASFGSKPKLKPLNLSQCSNLKKDNWDQELDKYHQKQFEEKKKMEQSVAQRQNLGPIAEASKRQKEKSSDPKSPVALMSVQQRQMPFPDSSNHQLPKKKPYRPFMKTYQQSKQLLKVGTYSKKKNRKKKYSVTTQNANSTGVLPLSELEHSQSNSLSAWVDAGDTTPEASRKKAMRFLSKRAHRSSIIYKPPPEEAISDPVQDLKRLSRRKQTECMDSDSALATTEAARDPYGIMEEDATIIRTSLPELSNESESPVTGGKSLKERRGMNRENDNQLRVSIDSPNRTRQPKSPLSPQLEFESSEHISPSPKLSNNGENKIRESASPKLPVMPRTVNLDFEDDNY